MHATTFELEQYVSDSLPAEASAELERHCDGCDACAESLAQEARLELSLRKLFAEQRCGTAQTPLLTGEGREHEVLRGEVRETPASRTQRPALYLLAAAACIALAFFTAHFPHHASTTAPALTTDAGDRFTTTPAPQRTFFDGDLAHGTP
ncbi:MAG: hypothetical protein QM723_32140 [Myxococcaceae bacterium]